MWFAKSVFNQTTKVLFYKIALIYEIIVVRLHYIGRFRSLNDFLGEDSALCVKHAFIH